MITEETSKVFTTRLREMKTLDNVLRAIKDLCKGGQYDKDDRRKIRMNEILQPLLQFLEVITTLEVTKDNLHSNKMYEAIIALINEKINL
jgi:hypothetical protein